MKYLKYFTIALIALTGYSCKQEKKSNNEFRLNDDVKNIISVYIEEHPQFNTFFLQSTQGREQVNIVTTQSGFLLGPGYERIIEECKPVFYFDVSDKRVFYLSPVDELMQRGKNEWIIRNEPDSIVIDDYWVIRKNHWDKFIRRSIFLYYNELGTLEVNFEPDTVFVGKYGGIDFDIPPVEIDSTMVE